MLINFIRYIIIAVILSVSLLLVLDNIILEYYVNTNKEIYIPDVRGMYKNSAVNKLKSVDLRVKIESIPYTKDSEIGKVIKMSPPSPIKIKTGRVIELSVPLERKNIVVPNLIKETVRNALIIIKNNNLEIDTIMYEYFSEYNKNQVTFQSPKPNQIVQSGTKVTMMVSKGPPPDLFIVPDLINLSLSRAENLIIQSGLRIGKIDSEYHPELLKETVIDQSLTPGMSISIPAKIDIIITSDD